MRIWSGGSPVAVSRPLHTAEAQKPRRLAAQSPFRRQAPRPITAPMPDAAPPDTLPSPTPAATAQAPSAGPEVLDLIGLRCPLPALKTRKALSRLPPGARLEVRCTDPLAAIDLPNLARETGDGIEALGPSHENGLTVLRFRFQRGGEAA